MSGNSFVTEDRPRIFNRGANIKILRLRIVRWNEIKTGRVLVVNARRIHEATGAGWLERVRQLANLKRAEIIWQRYEVVLLQKVDHFRLAALVRLQKRCLIERNVRAPCGIGIG